MLRDAEREKLAPMFQLFSSASWRSCYLHRLTPFVTTKCTILRTQPGLLHLLHTRFHVSIGRHGSHQIHGTQRDEQSSQECPGRLVATAKKGGSRPNPPSRPRHRCDFPVGPRECIDQPTVFFHRRGLPRRDRGVLRLALLLGLRRAV